MHVDLSKMSDRHLNTVCQRNPCINAVITVAIHVSGDNDMSKPTRRHVVNVIISLSTS